VIGTDRWWSEPPCVYPPAKAGYMANRRVGVEYSPSMLEPVRPGAVSPDRALCLPTFSHFVIVNKTSLSLSPLIPPPLPVPCRVAHGRLLEALLNARPLSHPLTSPPYPPPSPSPPPSLAASAAAAAARCPTTADSHTSSQCPHRHSNPNHS
jgi:hypothetical protein